MRNRCVAAAVGCVAVSGVSVGQVLITSGFDAPFEGWSAVTSLGLPVSVLWNALGGNPGGHLSVGDPDNGVTYWRAPASWLGLLPASLGGMVEFDVKVEPATPLFEDADVIIRSSGLTLAASAAPGVGPSWTRRSALMSPCFWRVGDLSGRVPTRVEFEGVLSSATELLIRAEYRSGTETDRFDNPTLRGPVGSDPRSSSTFDADTEGWTILNDANGPSWQPGGYIQAVDRGDGRYWWFVAPASYRGDYSRYVGGELSYDLWVSANESAPSPEGLVLIRGGGFVVVADLPTPPVGVWVTYRVPLAAGSWRLGTRTGPAPSEAEFLAVMSCVEEFRIRGEFSATIDTGWLDNVVFGGCGADWNCDGFVDFFDADDFVATFEGGSPPACRGSADFNGDGFVDFFDLDAYLGAFEVGC
ncbi:MAG: hypothetical protein HRU70_06765 [Phycisphaeraceae bacterium]|nr:MAG: hypothetical protein HRU70_06765 [Phycisphaeraceae bacterium]